MPAVNRESFASMPPAEVDVGPLEQLARRSADRPQVQPFGPVPANAVAAFGVNSVVSQVMALMGGWHISDDDCRRAVGLLQRLSVVEYAQAIEALCAVGALRVLCEACPQELRRDLAQSAVDGGMTTTSPPRSSRSVSALQAPSQPGLIVNSPSLPMELREVIHAENLSRARQYERALNRYVDAWCARVRTCRTPIELRALGPLSNPPALLEPGLGGGDFAAKRFVTLHSQTNIGLERAARAVSVQVSFFRGELAAGTLGLDFEVKAQLTRRAEDAGHPDAALRGALVAKGTLTESGRLIDQHAGAETVVEAGHGPVTLEGKFSAEGQLKAVAAELGGFAVEIERGGEVSFKATSARGLGAETFVDATRATFGAKLVADEEAELFGATLKVQAKIGFTAKGIERQYFADLGGAQPGFFGPMPELTEGKSWGQLPKDRREWYERQGFTRRTWP